MATTTAPDTGGRTAAHLIAGHDLADPADQAFWLLRVGFVVAPILFGLDKYFGVLTDWDRYLAPQFSDVTGASAHTLLLWVGAIEIAAGILVAISPRIGGYVVAAWLAAIIVDLLMLRDHYDVALRDFGLLIGALALARLATAVHRTGSSRTVGLA